jgi:hypothetical protein
MACSLAGMTGVNHHTHLIGWDGLLVPSIMTTRISASRVPETVGMNHCAWPEFLIFQSKIYLPELYVYLSVLDPNC